MPGQATITPLMRKSWLSPKATSGSSPARMRRTGKVAGRGRQKRHLAHVSTGNAEDTCDKTNEKDAPKWFTFISVFRIFDLVSSKSKPAVWSYAVRIGSRTNESGGDETSAGEGQHDWCSEFLLLRSFVRPLPRFESKNGKFIWSQFEAKHVTKWSARRQVKGRPIVWAIWLQVKPRPFCSPNSYQSSAIHSQKSECKQDSEIRDEPIRATGKQRGNRESMRTKNEEDNDECRTNASLMESILKRKEKINDFDQYETLKKSYHKRIDVDRIVWRPIQSIISIVSNDRNTKIQIRRYCGTFIFNSRLIK